MIRFQSVWAAQRLTRGKVEVGLARRGVFQIRMGQIDPAISDRDEGPLPASDRPGRPNVQISALESSIRIAVLQVPLLAE